MLIKALILMAPLQQAAVTDLAAFRQEATARLLEGRPLAPDYRHTLRAMPPADRIEAIIFLRRAGLMTGRSWPLDDLLKPALPTDKDTE